MCNPEVGWFDSHSWQEVIDCWDVAVIVAMCVDVCLCVFMTCSGWLHYSVEGLNAETIMSLSLFYFLNADVSATCF